MIIMFGPAGAGKSVQGQMLAARMDWRWISAGQLLRETRDPEILAVMQSGQMVSPGRVNTIMSEAIHRAKDIKHLILDGYPRQIEQATWLIDRQEHHQRDVKLVIVFELPQSEIEKRLAIRGRLDDKPEAIAQRMLVYRKEMYPVLGYFTEQGVRVVHIDATGSVGQVHDRIIEELKSCNLA